MKASIRKQDFRLIFRSKEILIAKEIVNLNLEDISRSLKIIFRSFGGSF